MRTFGEGPIQRLLTRPSARGLQPAFTGSLLSSHLDTTPFSPQHVAPSPAV